MKSVCAFLFVLAMMLTALPRAVAQEATTDSVVADEGGILVVATRVVPPFAFRDNTGEWAGLSVELWRDIAARLNLAYRFEETTLEDMLQGTADGRFDAAVAALTVTEERETLLDFTHPFFSTGLAIATVPGESSIWGTLAGLLSWEAVLVLLVMVAALLLVGVLMWWAERVRNAEYFGGHALDGIGSGVWQSLAMLVTTQYADQAPHSFMGRLVATLWVIASIILLTVFSGIVTSALTVQQIEGRVRGLADLL
jgi:polar amino acid transport system substrate-binding protein